jgi:hypothetical protein
MGRVSQTATLRARRRIFLITTSTPRSGALCFVLQLAIERPLKHHHNTIRHQESPGNHGRPSLHFLDSPQAPTTSRPNTILLNPYLRSWTTGRHDSTKLPAKAHLFPTRRVIAAISLTVESNTLLTTVVDNAILAISLGWIQESSPLGDKCLALFVTSHCVELTVLCALDPFLSFVVSLRCREFPHSA